MKTHKQLKPIFLLAPLLLLIVGFSCSKSGSTDKSSKDSTTAAPSSKDASSSTQTDSTDSSQKPTSASPSDTGKSKANATAKPPASKPSGATSQANSTQQAANAAGATKVAGIWSEMQPPEIVKLSASYSVDDLAAIFSQMDESQVASVLTLLPTAQAAKISKAIQKLASANASSSN